MKAKRYLFFLLLLIGTIAYSQKTYEFDYVMEYQSGAKDSLNSHYKFINSKDNSFMFIVWENGPTIMMKLVLDGGKFYYATIAKEDFFVEAISLKCPMSGYKKEYERLKDFEFIKKNDTVINTQKFGHFILKPLNKKDITKYKLLPMHYLMDNKYNFDSLFTTPQELAYRKWKKGEDVPKGIIKENYAINSKGDKILYNELIQCIPIKKIIIVDNDCN